MHLKDELDKLFEMYSNSLDKESKNSLKTLAKNENKINYKNLSYKILLPDGKVHIFNFLKKYGTLFSLLEDLITRKMSINSANADQISFAINLMHGYNEQDLFDM